MYRQPLSFAALALVSLGAACTVSEPFVPGFGSSSGAAGAPAAPFMPFMPIDQGPIVMGPASGSAGSAVATGGGGSGGVATCAGAPPPPPGMAPAAVFPLDLSGTVSTQEAHPPRPITGGTLLVLRDGSAAVASDPDMDRVYVVDLATRSLRLTIWLETGDEPGRLVEDGAGLVHVALRSGRAVATIDPATGTLVSRDAVCSAPRGLAYEATRDLIHVACAEGRVVSMRAKDRSVFRMVDLDGERDLRDVVSVPGGGLIVSTFRKAEALMLDADGRLSSRQRPPTVMRRFMPVPSPASAAVAWRMVPTGDGAIVLHQRGVDGPISATPGGYGGFGKGCGGIVESTVTIVAPGAEPTAGPALQMSTLAVDVALSPDRQQVAIASPGNAHTPLPQLQVESVATFRQSSDDVPCVVAGPPPEAVPMTGQVVSVAYAADGTLFAQTREPSTLWSADGRSAITLSTVPIADTGHLIFHANSGSGIACASCHPEGGEDGRVWNFACLGPRRTQSMRGGLSETAPFHWDGDMSSFPKLVEEVFVGRMGGPKTTDLQNAALLHWIDRVPNLPAIPMWDPGAVQRGRALFNRADVQCATCHVGDRLTNNMTVDVGTGGKLQVPSLRGVGWRAPFLHNGGAATLIQRFDAGVGGGDQHGHTSQLKAADFADLSAYLETL